VDKDHYTVELRIAGDPQTIHSVNGLLGLRHTYCSADYPHIRTYNPDRIIWGYDGGSIDDPTAKQWDALEDGLMFLLDIFLPKKELLDLHLRDCELTWWCGYFQHRFSGRPFFSPPLLTKLAVFGFPVQLSFY
jgi:hypothetical protein